MRRYAMSLHVGPTTTRLQRGTTFEATASASGARQVLLAASAYHGIRALKATAQHSIDKDVQAGQLVVRKLAHSAHDAPSAVGTNPTPCDAVARALVITRILRLPHTLGCSEGLEFRMWRSCTRRARSGLPRLAGMPPSAHRNKCDEIRTSSPHRSDRARPNAPSLASSQLTWRTAGWRGRSSNGCGRRRQRASSWLPCSSQTSPSTAAASSTHRWS